MKTDDEIFALLEELIKKIDYDIYKELFVYDDWDDDEIDELITIVREHIR